MIIFNPYIYYSFIQNIAYLFKTPIFNRDKIKIVLKYFELLMLRLIDPLIKSKAQISYGGKTFKGHTYDSLYFLFGEIFVRNCYFFRSLKHEPVVFDCGSNIGASLFYFKTLYPFSKIIAFEPDPSTFQILNNNINSNNFQNVIVYNKAVGKDLGIQEFYVEQSGSLTMSLDKNRGKGSPIKVEVTPLSDYINNSVDFIKIDIEGSELEVLEDLDLKDKFKYIESGLIEYHHNIPLKKSNLSSISLILDKNGFKYQLDCQNFPISAQDNFQDVLIYFYRPEIKN